ncbi:UNVERIFIED_CONTAM: hypothetical protein FKN15_000688 [Acipenser sinensis]
MNTRCPPKRVPSAARFFTLCRLTVQLPQSYSVGGQRSSGQLTGKPARAWYVGFNLSATERQYIYEERALTAVSNVAPNLFNIAQDYPIVIYTDIPGHKFALKQ